MLHLSFGVSRCEHTKAQDRGTELRSAWTAWMDQLGVALEGSNNPVKAARTIHADDSLRDDGGANPVVGLSFIDADNIGAAVEMAKNCPHLVAGGSIEIAELTRMDSP